MSHGEAETERKGDSEKTAGRGKRQAERREDEAETRREAQGTGERWRPPADRERERQMSEGDPQGPGTPRESIGDRETQTPRHPDREVLGGKLRQRAPRRLARVQNTDPSQGEERKRDSGADRNGRARQMRTDGQTAAGEGWGAGWGCDAGAGRPGGR